jgi:hypothetical protein
MQDAVTVVCADGFTVSNASWRGGPESSTLP